MSALSGPVTAVGIENPNLATNLYVHSAEHVGFGKDEKYALKATLGSTGVGSEVRLLQRPYGPIVAERWLHCREAGLPVPPTFREVTTHQGATDADKVLLVTDVTAGGAAVYGRGLSCHEERRPDGPLPNDTHFMRLTDDSNMPALQERAYALATYATKHNTILPIDDPFELIVNPDGSSKLMVLDLEHVRTNPLMRIGAIAKDNAQRVEVVLGHLTNLRSLLAPLVSADS